MHNKKLKFSLEKWTLLAQLLNSGYSLNEALKFFDPLDNHEMTNHRFYDLYINDRKGQFYNHLRFFYELYPLSKAIHYAKVIVDFNKAMLKQLVQTLFYPTVIFSFSLLILIFFANAILPQLNSQFNIESPIFSFMIVLPKILLGVAYLLIGCILIVLLTYFLQRKWFYKFLKILVTKIKLLRLIHSHYFLGYYAKLYECGLSSKEIMEYLLNLKSYFLFTKMIQEFHYKLNIGKMLVECSDECSLLDATCKYALTMAQYSDDVLTSYENGVQLLQSQIFKQIKYITIVVQFISYSMVIIVVIIMYQLMLLPLEMITQL